MRGASKRRDVEQSNQSNATGVATKEYSDVSTNLVSYAGTIRIRYDGFAVAISAPLQIRENQKQGTPTRCGQCTTAGEGGQALSCPKPKPPNTNATKATQYAD